MFNADLPTRAQLPTSAQLLRSTFLALAAAAALLVTVVLPAEYAIDPTGAGRFLGLTRMGEIKQELAAEAAQDATASPQQMSQTPVVGSEPVSAPTPAPEPEHAALQTRSDEMTVTLKPGQGAEIKMAMAEGAAARFEWRVTGGVVNYDLHGDGAAASKSYEQGRGVSAQAGTLTAAFNGNHGWFWRNRGEGDVTLTLRTSGEYSTIKRVK